MADTFLTWLQDLQADGLLGAAWTDLSADLVGGAALVKGANATIVDDATIPGLEKKGTIGSPAATSFTRAIASGGDLDHTNAVGYGALVRFSAWPPSGTPGWFGRNGPFFLTSTSTGIQAIGVMNNPAPPAGQVTTRSTPFALSLATLYHLYACFDVETGLAIYYVNGVPVAILTRPGALVAAATSFQIGASNGPTAEVWSPYETKAALGPSQLQKGTLAAGIALPDFYKPFGTDAAATSGTPGIGGGLRRAAEAIIQTASGRRWRAAQYGAQRVQTPAVWPSSGDAPVTVPVMAAKTIAEQAAIYTSRSHAGDLSYFDGQKYNYHGSSSSFHRESTGVTSGLAMAHVFSRLPADRSDLLDQVRAHVDWVMTRQTTSGALAGKWFDGDGTPSTWFTLLTMGKTALALGHDLDDASDPARFERLRAACVLAGNFVLSDTEQVWYPNGNIALMACVDAVVLYRLTGDAAWLAKAEVRWQNTLYPTNAVGSGKGAAQTANCGLRNITGAVASGVGAANPVNGAAIANDAALLALSDTADGAYLTEQTGAGGFGWDRSYAETQSFFAAALASLWDDPRPRKLANLLVNGLMPSLNTATWVLDATNGSRQNLSKSFLSPVLELLMWKGWRPDLSLNLGSHFSDKILTDFRAAHTSAGWSNGNYWYDVGETLGALLEYSAAWPGYKGAAV